MGSCLCRQLGASATACRSSQTAAGADDMEPKALRLSDTVIEHLVLEILFYVRSVQESSGEPAPLTRVHQLAETSEGWQFLMRLLIDTIPVSEPLGPSAIKIIFDACALPARKAVADFIKSLNLNAEVAQEAHLNETNEQLATNMILVLDCIADKFAALGSGIISQNTLNYLAAFLVDDRAPLMAVYALIVLERMAIGGGRDGVEAALASFEPHPLLALEQLHSDPRPAWRQLGFSARWALDNIFLIKDRQLSYMTEDMQERNVILNVNDKSGALKLSSNGLDVRCDSQFFESVRGTFEITHGVWYYEVELATAGVMQIGWATRDTLFESYGFYPAASFMAHQQCRFNFGATPFRFPPADRQFHAMNEFGLLTPEEKKIVPRDIKNERDVEEREFMRRCVICFDEEGTWAVGPCNHGEFCEQCLTQLRECPLCRSAVHTSHPLAP